eukprot:237053-Prymnesium_polylepis.1
MSDAADGRSAARCRNTIVRQNVFYRYLSHLGLRHVGSARASSRGGGLPRGRSGRHRAAKL